MAFRRGEKKYKKLGKERQDYEVKKKVGRYKTGRMRNNGKIREGNKLYVGFKVVFF